MEATEKKSCRCPCHKSLGLFIALIGLVFLLGNTDVLSQKVVQMTWPILLMLIGLKKAFKGMCKCCSDS